MAKSFIGSLDNSLYTYSYWEEGLAILVWHDYSFRESGCGGNSSTEGPKYRLECFAEASNVRRFTWEVLTSDGVRAQMWINDKSYDLDRGSLFLVSSQNNQIFVDQLQRDLADLKPSEGTFRTFANNDSAVANFVAHLKNP